MMMYEPIGVTRSPTRS